MAPFLTLLAAWVLFFWQFAAPAPGDRVTYPAGDFTQQFGVFRDVAYRALAAGRWPLWADCLYSGYPFHADPQAQIFYPPLWLIFGFLRLQGWGNFPIEALVAEVALHYLLTSLFLFLFLRSLRLRPAAAVLGALVFTYGGYLTGFPPLQTAVLEVDTWLPLTLLFAGRLAETRRLRDLALAALALAVAYLAGHPQSFLYVALLTLAYFTFRAAQARWAFGALAGRAAAIAGLASALAAVQLLPTAQFVLNSTRASVPFDQAGTGFPFQDILQFLLTGFVSYWQPLYVGLLPLGLAAFALSGRRAEVRFWAGAALAGLVLSFGMKGVAYDAAYWIIPGYRFFRGQERLALVVSFALAVLAAFGAHDVLGPLSRRARQWLQHFLRAGKIFFIATMALLALAMYLAQLGLDSTAWHQLPDRVGVLALGVGLGLLALTLRARLPELRRGVPAAFVVVVVLDLFAADRPVNRVPLYPVYPYNPLLDPIITDTGFFRVQDDFQLPGHAGCAYGYRAVEGVTPVQVAAYSHFVQRAPEVVRWQLLGVKYVVTWRAALFNDSGQTRPAEVVAQGSVPDEKGNVTKVYRLAGEPRRAFLAHQVEVAPTDEALYSALTASDFDPSSTVILPSVVGVSLGGGGDQVEVLSDVPGHLRLRADSDGAAVLVVGEVYFPGWRATVDDQPVPLLRADGTLMGVSLSPGAHEVDLVYRPASLLWGAAISLLALLLSLACLMLDRARPLSTSR